MRFYPSTFRNPLNNKYMFKIMSSREYNGLVSKIDAARKEIEARVLADAEKIKDLQLKVHETKMALDTCKTRKADIQKDADQYKAALSAS